jgi:hypothetical protein
MAELYVVNVHKYEGLTTVADQWLKRDTAGTWADLFERNPAAKNYWSSRSAACVDRQGDHT